MSQYGGNLLKPKTPLNYPIDKGGDIYDYIKYSLKWLEHWIPYYIKKKEGIKCLNVKKSYQ